MEEGGKAKDIGGQGTGKGGKLLACWKRGSWLETVFKAHTISDPIPPPPTPPSSDTNKIEFCESMSCWYYNVFANFYRSTRAAFKKSW